MQNSRGDCNVEHISLAFAKKQRGETGAHQASLGEAPPSP